MTAPAEPADGAAAIRAAAARIIVQGQSTAQPARDPVNQPMINNWCEALGVTNPRWTKGEAPPAMAQVWTMPGLHGYRDATDPLGAMMIVLDEAGYTSVVATDSEQTYLRTPRLGEHFAAAIELEDVTGPKATALGEGWFVTTLTTWSVGGEPVATMRFRILKFRPGGRPAPAGAGEIVDAGERAAAAMRPVISRDTAFFWAGTALGELRIQRWGGVLRHPPGPMPPPGVDPATESDYQVATGLGTVYSYVVHHRPAVPGKELPFVVALVELDEGVRVLGEVLDIDTVHIGQRVRAVFLRIDAELTLPAWRVVA